MAVKMIAIIVAGALGGVKLDEWLDTAPAFTLSLTLLSVGLAMWVIIRDLTKP